MPDENFMSIYNYCDCLFGKNGSFDKILFNLLIKNDSFTKQSIKQFLNSVKVQEPDKTDEMYSFVQKELFSIKKIINSGGSDWDSDTNSWLYKDWLFLAFLYNKFVGENNIDVLICSVCLKSDEQDNQWLEEYIFNLRNNILVENHPESYDNSLVLLEEEIGNISRH